jgi:predicted Zn-dependent protease
MTEKSNDLLDQILTHGPSQGTLFLILKNMRQEGRTREALQACLKALDFYPDDIRLRQLLAQCYSDLGFLGQAERELDRVTSEIRSLMPVYKLQAENYAGQGRGKEALAALRQYLSHCPDDPEAVGLLKKIESEIQSEEERVQEPVHTSERGLLDASCDSDFPEGPAELKVSDKAETTPLPAAKKPGRSTEERMISSLETWLDKIKELDRG